MEKLDILVWDSVAGAVDLTVPGLRGWSVGTPATVDNPPLMMGQGPALAGLVQIWLDSVDVWPQVLAQIPGDAYLVTESVPQPVSQEPGLLTHFTWFPKPERLSEPEFFHGWHDIHTPSSAALHPLRKGYVRDAVARTLTPHSPPVRAIVSEYFALQDYLDPRRLFGGKEALQVTMAELPLYADDADLSCCPLWQTTYPPRS